MRTPGDDENGRDAWSDGVPSFAPGPPASNRDGRLGWPPGDEVRVPVGRFGLTGWLSLPSAARTVVTVTGEGAGGRRGPLGRAVASRLHLCGLGTLTLDLPVDSGPVEHRGADVGGLAARVRAVSHWLGQETGRSVGGVGIGPLVPAMLRAAADESVTALACVGGRPELAGPAALTRVATPALFVVGGLDSRGPGLGRLVDGWMRCPRRVAVVPGATVDLSRGGVPADVAGLVGDWFSEGARNAPRPAGDAGLSAARPD
ncbi:alpha/beta hydrolase [Streptomyces sp. ZYX-F-203]